MKNLSPKEAITILEGMRIDIPVPKAAVTQIKRNLALDMAINSLKCSEIPNISDSVSRQAAIEALDEQIALCDKALNSFGISMKDEYAVKVERASLVAYKEQLEALPAADVAPVVHGRWIPYRCDMYECSVCGHIHTSFDKEECDANYCPNCGTKMRGEQE